MIELSHKIIMKKLKKVLCILLALSMMFSVVACNKDESDEQSDPSTGTDTENNEQDGQTEDTTNENNTEETVDVTEYPFTFEDASGNEIVLEEAPEKIASGAPSLTEMIYALDKQDSLVGVTEYCNYPEEAKTKEIIGGYSEANIEKLIELETDLFLTEYVDDATKATLNDAGITVVLLSSPNYSEVLENIELIAEMLDANEEGASLLEYINSKTAYIIETVAEQESVKVFYEVWHDPLTAAGPGSFMHEMIEMLGGENIAGDAESAYPEFSTELVIAGDPQVYMTANDGFKTVEEIKARPGYNEIDAIKNGKIYFLNQDIISRPGPRIVDALEVVARAMYPAAFNEGK